MARQKKLAHFSFDRSKRFVLDSNNQTKYETISTQNITLKINNERVCHISPFLLTVSIFDADIKAIYIYWNSNGMEWIERTKKKEKVY